MKSIEILYLSYTGMTEPLGRSQVLAYLQGLILKGPYKFTIVSFENPVFFAKDKDIIQQICLDAGIDWHPLPYTNKPPAIATLRRIRAIRKKVKQLHKEKQFSMVHCRSYRSALVGLWMKQKFGTRFIFDMRGFWVDERVDGGLWNLNNPVYKRLFQFFKKKERSFLQQADYTISLTENGKKEIDSWKIAKHPIPVSVIPCCVDLDLFNPGSIKKESQDQLRKQLGIKQDQFVLSYLGSLGTWYLLDEMLQFYRLLLKKQPDAVFLFITNESSTMIHKSASALDIEEDKIIIVSAKRQEVPLYLSLSNYSLFFIKPSFSKKASSPVKQGEIMALGIPVICNNNVGDTAEIVQKYKAGHVITALDEKGYHSVINNLETQSFDHTNIRKGAIEYFSLESGVEKYDEVYKKVLNISSIDN